MQRASQVTPPQTSATPLLLREASKFYPRKSLVVGSRKCDCEGEERRLVALSFLLAHVIDADPWLVVEDRTKSLSVGDGRIHRRAEINGEGFGPLGNPFTEDCDRKRPVGLAG